MTIEDQTGEFQLIEELTAYLDGELDEQAHQRVEDRLNSDPEYLSEMQTLQQTWDLLDRLPQTAPNVSFTKTTMEMIVQDAKKEATSKFSWIWPTRIVAVLAAFSVLFSVGFAGYRMIQGQPDDYLIDHLATIENREKYFSVNNELDFLTQMNERGYFSRNQLGALDVEGEVVDQIDQLPGLYSEDREKRIAWVKGLDVAQKGRLKKRLDEFRAIDPEEQEKALEFGRRLMSHAERAELVYTLNEYYDWLKTLEAAPRARFLDTQPMEARLEEIASLRAKQARKEFGATNDLSATEAELVFNWFRAVIDSNESQIREHFPVAVANTRRQLGQTMIPEQYLKRLAGKIQLNQLVDYLIEIDRPFVEAIATKDEEVELLIAMLNPSSRRVLEDKTGANQRELIIDWVRGVNQSYLSVSREKLLEFYDALSQDDRDELDKLSQSEHIVRLKELYLERNRMASDRRPFDWRAVLKMENPFRSKSRRPSKRD